MHDKILQIPDQAWELDVAQQTADITAHLHRLLREGADRTHRSCKKIYRDDEGWTLKNHKLATRKRIKATNGHLKRQFLQCCFSAWRTLRPPQALKKATLSSATVSHYDVDLSIWWRNFALNAPILRKY